MEEDILPDGMLKAGGRKRASGEEDRETATGDTGESSVESSGDLDVSAEDGCCCCWGKESSITGW